MNDLQTLSKPTGGASDHAVPMPRARRLTRYALPGAILIAVLLLIGYASRDLILPAARVELTRATPIQLNSDSAASASPGSVVAQAPGWVEPDPFPIYVSALADGVVERVEVLEGDAVKAGQPLVRLVDIDARLMLEKAEAELANREAALHAATIELDEPIALRRSAAVAQARVAETKASAARLDAQVAQEAAKLAELQAAYKRLAAISEASVSPLQLDAAKYQMQSQQAAVEATRKRRPELDAAIAIAEAEYKAAARDLELKTALQETHDKAAAAAQAAKAAVAEARLRFERMTITSPIDGVVMERLAAPGHKLTLNGSERHSAHVIHLYDPASLQVRVDVPLADAASVGVDQQALIVVDVLPDTQFKGVVTRVVHQADIAKNTVQFKVAIADPSPLLKPDMLARVKFLGRSTGKTGSATALGSSQAVAISSSAVITEDGRTYVWWVSPKDSRIEQRDIELGQVMNGGSVQVLSGLNPGDALVDQPDATLKPGVRVRPAAAE